VKWQELLIPVAEVIYAARRRNVRANVPQELLVKAEVQGVEAAGLVAEGKPREPGGTDEGTTAGWARTGIEEAEGPPSLVAAGVDLAPLG